MQCILAEEVRATSLQANHQLSTSQSLFPLLPVSPPVACLVGRLEYNLDCF
jgi:hypothetical protein